MWGIANENVTGKRNKVNKNTIQHIVFCDFLNQYGAVGIFFLFEFDATKLNDTEGSLQS